MSDVTDTSLGIEAHKRRGLLGDFFIRLVREKPLGTAGGLVVLVLLCAGIFADVLAPYPYAEIHLESILEGPSGQYLLGTDQLGRDVLSRIIYGARVSVIVGLAATTISVLGATALGGLCGFLGGKLDLIVQRLVDAWMAFPGLLLFLTIMSVVGRGMPQLIVVLGIIGWFGGSRVSRSAVIGIKENMYMMAAKSIGSPAWRTLIRHVLPNMLAPVIIMFTTGIGGVILAEASLSFLGYGLPPDVPSWGGMLSGEGRRFMEMAPRLALWPGFCLSIVVYGTNMFGDALRDLLDPRLRGGVGRMGAYGAKSESMHTDAPAPRTGRHGRTRQARG